MQEATVSVISDLPQSFYVGGLDAVGGHRCGGGRCRRTGAVAVGKRLMVDGTARGGNA